MPNIYGNSEIWGDLLVTGSFSILGSASSIYTTSLVVSDTIISLGHSQSGSPILDEGIMFTRGTGLTQAFIWDESDDTFALINTNDDHTVIGDVNILGYSNLRLGGLTTSTIKISNGAASGYLLQSDASGNATWVSATSSSANFANTDLTLTSNRTHELSGWDLVIGQGVSQTIGMYNGFSTQITYQNSIWEIASNYQQFDVAGTNSLTLFTTEAVFNDGGKNYDFRVEGDTEPNLFFVDASTDRIGIGTASPTSKLYVLGSSYFVTSQLTTSTGDYQFRFLNGVNTPSVTNVISSSYKEYRPTSTTNIVINSTNLMYPNITSSSNAEFFGSVNASLYTGDLGLLTNNFPLTGSANLIQIQTDTGTLSSSVGVSSTLRNVTSGAVINRFIAFRAVGLDGAVTNNGTTNNIYGFYMANQSLSTGAPATASRWGVYIEDGGYNYFAGRVGIGTTSPSQSLHVIGTVSTTGFRMTNGAANGYILQSDASGNATWIDTSSASLLVTSSNGLSTLGSDVRIGGTLSQYTSISLESNNFIINKNSTGFFGVEESSRVAYMLDSTFNSNILLGEQSNTENPELRFRRRISGPAIVGPGGITLPNSSILGDITWTGNNITSGPTESSIIRSTVDDTSNGITAELNFLTKDNTGLSQKMVIKSNGDVGIGTASPSYKLHVLGTVSTTGFRMTDGATNGYVLTSDASGVASWQSLPSGVSVYSSTQSFTGGVTYSINHALSTDNILVNVWDESSGELIYVKATKTSANNVDLNSTVTLASGRIVIMGG